MRALPWCEGGLAVLALALCGWVVFVPPSPMRGVTLLTRSLLSVWAVWRLGRFVWVWRQQWAWHTAPGWRLPTSVLPYAGLPGWVPRCLAPRAMHVSAWSPPGFLLGRAFRWNARHTQALAFALARDGALPVANDIRGGHPALHAVGRRQEQFLRLPWAELSGHVLLAGTTRSGKTRCLELLVTEALRAPGAVVVLDPKGDSELLARCAWEAEQQGRDFALFSPAFAHLSATFNPLETATTPAEVGARVQALMPGGGEKRGDPFFTEYPLAILERVAAAQAALGQRWTLEGLAAPTVLRPQMETLLLAYLQRLLGMTDARATLQSVTTQYRRQRRSDPVADALLDDLEKPRDHFQKVTANLIPAFRGVTGEPFGRLLSTLPADLTWERIAGREMVVYFALSSLLLGEVANRIGRVILQDLTGYLGRRYAYDDVRTSCPITVFVDEFSNVAYPLFVDAINKGGGANARFLLAMQSLADPEATMGREHAQRVLDNLNTKIWFRLADPRTAETATEGLGVCTVVVPEDGGSLSYGGPRALGSSVTRHFKRQETPLLRPEWLMALPRGEAVVRLRGEVWKLRVPLLDPPPPTVLARLGLTDLTPPLR